MSTELADAYIALHAKMPGVKAEIAQALGDVDVDDAGRKIGRKASDGAGKGFALGGAVAGITATLTNMIAGSIGGLVAEAVAASDATDKFKQTLDFAGVDNSQIEALTASTREYADRTVYDLGAIQNTTAQLAANGIKDYDKLAEAAGNLNAVAGGSAETFKSVGMVLTQTAGQGKLTTENWNQLSDAIPGASGMLQKALLDAGAYTGNFREAMEKGEISAEEFNAALLDLGTQPVAVEAATSVSTFEGAIGNLRATIVGGLGDGLNAIKPILTTAISGLADLLGMVFDFIGALGSGVDLSMFAELLGYFTPLGIAIKLLQPLLPLLMDAFSQIAGVLGGVLAQSLPIVAQAFTLIGSVLASAIGTILPVIVPLFLQLVQLFGDLAAQVLPMLMPILLMLADLFATVLQAVMPIVSILIAALMPILQALIPVVVSILDAFLPLIAALVSALAPILTTVADIIAALLIPILDLLVAAIQWVANIITWLVQNVVVPFLLGVMIPAVQNVGQIFNDVFSGLGSFFEGIWSGIVRGFRGFINAIIDGINGFIRGLNEVGNFISDATGGAVDFSIGTIPRLEAGGIVQSTPGGILANIGEGRYDEVVLPLSPEVLGQLGGGGLRDGDRLTLVVDGREMRAYVKARAAEVASAAAAPFAGGRR